MVRQRAGDGAVPAGTVRHHGRGLCGTCRTHAARHGELADYQRSTRPIADTLAEHAVLRTFGGLEHDQVAARLGIKPASLQRQLDRARTRNTRITCEEHTR